MSSNYLSENEKATLSRECLKILKNIESSLREIKTLLEVQDKRLKTNDKTFSSLKDKDLIRLEVNASRNNNHVVLDLVKQELNNRGLFIEGSSSGVSKATSEKVTVNR